MSNSLLLRRRLLLDNNKIDLGYVSNGIVFQIDGIFNTKNGNDKTSNVWEDLVGDNFVPIGSNTWGLNCLNCSSNIASNKVIPDLGENCTMEIVYKYEGTTNLKKRMLINLVQSNAVLKDEQLLLELKPIFYELAKLAKNDKWYPQANSNRCLHRERVLS